MSCPNCKTQLTYLQEDGQNVYHCKNCGASFFEENGINRISPATAAKLSQDKITEIIMGGQKLCPKDLHDLIPVSKSEAIPPNVTLLQCEHCHGIFVYPEDLLLFKNAQNIKLSYFKLWGKPLPALNTILVLAAVFIFALTILISSSSLQNSTTSQTKAEDVITKVVFTASSRYIFITFQTVSPMKSVIVIKNTATNAILTKTISNKYTTVHYLATGDVSKNDILTYHIILTTPEGKTIVTEEKTMEIK